MNGDAPETVPDEVIDLVGKYFDACERGHEPTLEALCAGRPDLRKPVAYAIADSRRARQAMRGTGGSSPLPAAGVAGRFGELRFVARGGMGEVFRAVDQEADREVAYKVVHPRNDCGLFRDYLLNEARLTAALAHPAIVPVYAVVQDGCGRPAYAMEFIAGETLYDAIERRRAAPDAAAVPTLRTLLGHVVAVGRAVAHAHAHGVTHGDIKSNNVRVRTDGRPFVIDWGLARRHPDGVPAEALAADVAKLARLLDHVLDADGVPPALAATREAALGGRYRSADGLAESVQQWLDTGGTPDYRDFWTVRAVRWANRRKATATSVAAGLLFLLAATSAGIWYHFDSERKRVALATAERETVSNREWARHQEGLVFSIDALRHFGSPRPEGKGLGLEKARAACELFAALADDFRDEPAHRVRLNESRFMLGGFLLILDRPADGFAELRRAEAGFTELAEWADVAPLASRLNVRADSLTADNFVRYRRECRLLRGALLLVQRQYHDAFVLIDGVARERGVAIPPLDKRLDPVARQLTAMKGAALTEPSLILGAEHPPEAILALRDTAIMALEQELSHLPHSRGATPDHARGMREAAVLADAARVSEAAVYNTACTFAVAAAEPGIPTAERERRAATAGGYLRRLVTSGYFHSLKQLTDLQNDIEGDFKAILDRDDFRAVLTDVWRQWAVAFAVGGWRSLAETPPSK